MACTTDSSISVVEAPGESAGNRAAAGILRPVFTDGIHDLFNVPQTRFAFLDVLRSAAILLVFTGHFLRIGLNAEASFGLGWTGVDLFFVLSGFLIGSQLWKELARTGRIKIGHFLLRRGLRIWPLYYFVLGVISLGFLWGRTHNWLWTDIVFLSNVVFRSKVPGSWSLATEEQFYIFAPVALALFAIKLPPRRLWVVPLLGSIFLIAVRALVISNSALSEYDLHQRLYFPSYTHADGLPVGLLIAWLFVFCRERLQQRRFTIMLAAGMLLSGLLVYKLNPMLFNFTALGLIFGAFTLYGVSSLPQPAPLRWRGFHVLSRLSYGVYLNHLIVLDRVLKKIPWDSHTMLGAVTSYLFCLALSMLLACITFLLVEWPFLRLREKWLDQRNERPSVSVRSPMRESVCASGEEL